MIAPTLTTARRTLAAVTRRSFDLRLFEGKSVKKGETGLRPRQWRREARRVLVSTVQIVRATSAEIGIATNIDVRENGTERSTWCHRITAHAAGRPAASPGRVRQRLDPSLAVERRSPRVERLSRRRGGNPGLGPGRHKGPSATPLEATMSKMTVTALVAMIGCCQIRVT